MNMKAVTDNIGYVAAKPDPGYTFRMTYMCRDSICTIIDVNFLDRQIKIKNYTSDLLLRAFGCGLGVTPKGRRVSSRWRRPAARHSCAGMT